jgi:hypothetical protein
VLLITHRQGPRAGELLDALALDSLAYKSPRRSNEWTHTTPSYLPDTSSSPSSFPFDVASSAGEVLDAGGAIASGRRWTRRRCQAEELSSRRRSASSPSSPASSPSSPRRRTLVSARR